MCLFGLNSAFSKPKEAVWDERGSVEGVVRQEGEVDERRLASVVKVFPQEVTSACVCRRGDWICLQVSFKITWSLTPYLRDCFIHHNKLPERSSERYTYWDVGLLFTIICLGNYWLKTKQRNERSHKSTKIIHMKENMYLQISVSIFPLYELKQLVFSVHHSVLSPIYKTTQRI